MTLINQDQIDGEFQVIEVGVGPFATAGNLRFGSTGEAYIRNVADDDNLLVFSHQGGDPEFDDRVLFANVFGALKLAGNGQSAQIVAGNEVVGGGITLIAGDGEVQGGDILLHAGDASEIGIVGGVNLQAGSGVDGGGAAVLFAGNASADSTAGGSLEIGNGLGKGAPVSAIQFFTAGSEAVASDTQTSNLRGTMADEVFTWDGVFKLTPRAFADLPAAPSEGMMAWVNDSNTATWGATVAGGGANKILAVYNGANWTCAGK